MPTIQLLDQATIDKIAAGEVVERPSSVVKELVENAIDAKATAVTVEIKEGGISFIRITEALQVSADSLLRSDIPEVSHIYNAEFSELLSDCSPSEIDSIMKIAAELKAAFHSHKAEYDS